MDSLKSPRDPRGGRPRSLAPESGPSYRPGPFLSSRRSEFLLEGGFATLRRRELDALIVEEACRSGAQFVDGIRMKEPLFQDDACVGARGVGGAGGP